MRTCREGVCVCRKGFCVGGARGSAGSVLHVLVCTCMGRRRILCECRGVDVCDSLHVQGESMRAFVCSHMGRGVRQSLYRAGWRLGVYLYRCECMGSGGFSVQRLLLASMISLCV